MAGITAKINAKNMDYFKFKKIVIDGSREDYESCSREIRSLCDAVQTLSFRDEQFADDRSGSGSDRRHLDEILAGYRLILTGKRVDPVDIRVKTGWWADSAGSAASSCGSAGKFKSSALRETLLRKTADWWSRQCASEVSAAGDELDRPGVFVLKHRERQCFQYVGRTAGQRGGVFAACADLLKSTFDGTIAEPIGALLVVSMVADWDFYYRPLAEHDDDRMLRIAVNDAIIRHDALWPRGLNELLYVESPLEVAELRLSCLRHRWPPADAELQPCETQLNLPRLRARFQQQSPSARPASGVTTTKKGGGGAPRPSSTTTQPTSPTKSTQQQQQQQPVRSGLPSPTKRRPATTTTTRSTTASSPTKTPRSRPQSAPKPSQPPTVTSSRPPQPSTGTPRSRSQTAKFTTGASDDSASKPGTASTPGREAAASADAQLTNTSVNGASPSPHHENTHYIISATATAESSHVVINTLHNEPIDCAITPGYQQIPTTVEIRVD